MFDDFLAEFAKIALAALSSFSAVAVVILGVYLRKKLGLDIDASQRVVLTDAAVSGLKHADQIAPDAPVVDKVAIAKQYVATNTPDALAHFGLTVDSPELDKKVVALLPAAPPTPPPTEAAPLAPQGKLP